MYSMKRTMWPVPRKWRAIGTTLSSLTPRLTTMLILIGPSPAAAAASIPASTRSTGKPTSLTTAKHLVVEAVEADRDPAQPGVPERPRLARQRRAVGGHRQVPKPGDPREHLDKPLHLAAHERLAAGQADLRHPMVADEDPRQPLDLLKPQKLGALEELVVAPEDLAGHAVD